MPSLNDIQHEIENALTALDDFEGEEDERQAVAAAIEPYLAALATQEAGKVDAIAKMDRRTENEIEFLKEEEKRVAAKRRTLERRRASFREFLKVTMMAHGLKKLAGHSATLSLRTTESVLVTGNPQSLPQEFVTTTISYAPKKTEIKAALKAGMEIPGCEIVHGQTVQVR